MNQIFKELIIKEHEDMNPRSKWNFLRTLKSKPEKVLQIIFDNIHKWATKEENEIGNFEILDVSRESQELLEAFQEHFAQEMADITEQQILKKSGEGVS